MNTAFSKKSTKKKSTKKSVKSITPISTPNPSLVIVPANPIEKTSNVSIINNNENEEMNEDMRGQTYLISGFMGLNQNMLRIILNEKGMIEVQKGQDIEYVDFLYMELDQYRGGFYDKWCYAIKSKLRNLIDDSKRKIDKKSTLYANMMTNFPQYTERHFAKTIFLEELEKVKENEVWIIKLVDGFLGKNMVIVNTQDKLIEARERLISMYGLRKVVACEYIQNILLVDEKKMHLRFYFLISTFEKKVHVYNQAEIVGAVKKFQRSEYDDMDIHDSHFGITVQKLPETKKRFFPDEFPYSDEIKENIMHQMKEYAKKIEYIMHDMEPPVRPFANYDYGYQLFSCDCLIQEDANVIVMEMGSTPSFFEKYVARDRVDPLEGPWTDNYSLFCYNYYRWIYKHCIKPVLFNRRKISPLING
jgi:hypothetical protein